MKHQETKEIQEVNVTNIGDSAILRIEAIISGSDNEQ